MNELAYFFRIPLHPGLSPAAKSSSLKHLLKFGYPHGRYPSGQQGQLVSVSPKPFSSLISNQQGQPFLLPAIVFAFPAFPARLKSFHLI